MRVVFLFSLALSVVLASEPLDPRAPEAHPVLTDDLLRTLGRGKFELTPQASDLRALINLQTPVKSQGSRGTCSIFAATAMVESLVKINDQGERDLSENYLEFLVMNHMKGYPSEGSDAHWNFPAFQQLGAIPEEGWPYETFDWSDPQLPQFEAERRQRTCGHLTDRLHAVCILSHLDPTNNPHHVRADQIRQELGLSGLRYNILFEERQIKELLWKNIPVNLSLEFFYRAWNHRKMVEYGLGPRNMGHWNQGIVSTPDREDIAVSRRNPAGHSIVIVGYNDEKRVYYFKNSWGTDGFGVDSQLVDGLNTQGYGSITYEYAYKHGTFYQVRLR